MFGPQRSNPETPSETRSGPFRSACSNKTEKQLRICVDKIFLPTLPRMKDPILFLLVGFFAGPVWRGKGSQIQGAAAVLILGLASKRSHSQAAQGSACCFCSPCQDSGTDIFLTKCLSDDLLIYLAFVSYVLLLLFQLLLGLFIRFSATPPQQR